MRRAGSRPAKGERHRNRRGQYACTAALLVWTLLTPGAVVAQSDRIYFPSVDNVRSLLVSAIAAETVRIDVSAWYLTEHSISLALVAARRRGVEIRLIGDRGSIFEIDPRTKAEFYWLANQGIPIRLRYHPTWFPEIQHWKASIFKGQGLVAFGSANYTPSQLAPDSLTNYSDETVLFSTDPALVQAFLTKFDVIWNDTTTEPGSQVGPPYLLNWDTACGAEAACADYRALYPSPAPMAISTARLEPNHPMPQDLIWSQGPAFNSRLIREIQDESVRVRFAIYRLTAAAVADALLAKFGTGVPVQLIVEPSEYLNRKWPEFWLTHANIDRLWAAGVPIKQRRHDGLTHMKMLVTSRYATNASSNVASNWQRDTNYFVPASSKPGVHGAMASRFDAMWSDQAGFVDFVPAPPDRPRPTAPAVGSAVSRTPTLTWAAAAFATSYEIHLGTSPDALIPAGTVSARLVNDPPATYSWTSPTTLAPGTTHYWKVVARTNATVRDPALVAESTVGFFLTSGTATGPVTRPPAAVPGDFDGDRRANAAVFRRPTGEWYIRGVTGVQYGTGGDIPVPGDYDGDRRVDIAVYRPSTGVWWILPSSNWSTMMLQWGNPGSRDIPLPADYDGDGKTDLGIYRPETGAWWLLRSSAALSYASAQTIQWGNPGSADVPVPGDYDGDGRADLAIWRPGTGVWWLLGSRGGYSYGGARTVQWGLESERDVPVPSDYDGDGRTDIAVWRPGTGTWWVLRSRDGYSWGTAFTVQWGIGSLGDIPLPADHDGDGRADIVIYRPGSAEWFVRRSNGEYTTYWSFQYGDRAQGDVPIAAGPVDPRIYLR